MSFQDALRSGEAAETLEVFVDEMQSKVALAGLHMSPGSVHTRVSHKVATKVLSKGLLTSLYKSTMRKAHFCVGPGGWVRVDFWHSKEAAERGEKPWHSQRYSGHSCHTPFLEKRGSAPLYAEFSALTTGFDVYIHLEWVE